MIFYICFIIAIFILDLILGNYIKEEETDNKSLIQLLKSLIIFIIVIALSYLLIKSDFLYNVLQEKYVFEKANNIRIIFYLIYLLLNIVNLYSLFEVSIDSYTDYLVNNNNPKKYLVLIATFIFVIISHILLLNNTNKYSVILGNNNFIVFIAMIIITVIYPALVAYKIYKYVSSHEFFIKNDKKEEDEVIARKVEIVEKPVEKVKHEENTDDYYEDEFLNDFDDDSF